MFLKLWNGKVCVLLINTSLNYTSISFIECEAFIVRMCAFIYFKPRNDHVCSAPVSTDCVKWPKPASEGLKNVCLLVFCVFSGFVRARQQVYLIEPLGQSEDGEHAVYRREHLKTSGNPGCGSSSNTTTTLYDQDRGLAGLFRSRSWVGDMTLSNLARRRWTFRCHIRPVCFMKRCIYQYIQFAGVNVFMPHG